MHLPRAIRRVSFVATLFLCGTLVARAQILVSVRESDNVLVRIDTGPATPTLTPIGPLGVSFDFGGLAWNPLNSTLYMIGGRGNDNLYTVNVNTGAATLVGPHGINDLFGLEFDPSTNTLFGSRWGGPSIYTLNISTGAATQLGNANVSMGGLAYDSNRNMLVGIVDGAGSLYSINRSTGDITLLASSGGNNDSGLAFDPFRDRLWDIDWSGNLYYYDIGNGYLRTLALSGLGAYDGLAMINVPEPSTWCLLGIGGILLFARARRTHAKL